MWVLLGMHNQCRSSSITNHSIEARLGLRHPQTKHKATLSSCKRRVTMPLSLIRTGERPTHNNSRKALPHHGIPRSRRIKEAISCNHGWSTTASRRVRSPSTNNPCSSLVVSRRRRSLRRERLPTLTYLWRLRQHRERYRPHSHGSSPTSSLPSLLRQEPAAVRSGRVRSARRQWISLRSSPRQTLSLSVRSKFAQSQLAVRNEHLASVKKRHLLKSLLQSPFALGAHAVPARTALRPLPLATCLGPELEVSH